MRSIPQALGCFQRAPEVRSLPSTGVTPLPRYYGPVRHPSAARPVPRGRPVGGHAPPPLGLPVLRSISLCRHAVAITPVATLGQLSLDRSQRPGLPHPFAGSATTLAVSRPARRSLTLRPVCSRSPPRGPFPSKASAVSLPPLPLRLLPAGAKGAGQELHLLKISAFARRTKGTGTSRLSESSMFPQGSLGASPLFQRADRRLEDSP